MQIPNLPQLGADGCILEGIVTTRNADGSVNISPMGPIVDEPITQFVFRPYKTSTTFQNLKREGCGVFHVTDDVLLFAQAAVGDPDPLPPLEGLILLDACCWFRFEISLLDDSEDRTNVLARVVDQRSTRDFLGFNRAKHAVLELAILATRVHLLPAEHIQAELARLESPVLKTASSKELKAYAYLLDYITQASCRDVSESLP